MRYQIAAPAAAAHFDKEEDGREEEEEKESPRKEWGRPTKSGSGSILSYSKPEPHMEKGRESQTKSHQI
jgi:hypothetical protein